MDKDALTQGFRARAAQLMAWLTGVQQQERQQQMQNDRLTLDGANRGADDPDNRRQQQMLVPQQGIPYLDEGTRHAQREIQERWQDAQRAHGIAPQPAMDRASSQTQRSADGLAAQVEALRQRLQGQQQSQQQSRSRGQGMGW